MHPVRSACARQRRALKRGLRSIDAYAFFDLVADLSMLDKVESHPPAHRERLLPPTEFLAMFLAQALSADRSCQHAVDTFVTHRVAGGLSACSTAIGAFCRARRRLPEAMVESLLRFTGHHLSAEAPLSFHWQGRRVRFVDGSCVPLPDMAANQAAFAQPRSQKPGLGFQLCPLPGSCVCPAAPSSTPLPARRRARVTTNRSCCARCSITRRSATCCSVTHSSRPTSCSPNSSVAASTDCSSSSDRADAAPTFAVVDDWANGIMSSNCTSRPRGRNGCRKHTTPPPIR